MAAGFLIGVGSADVGSSASLSEMTSGAALVSFSTISGSESDPAPDFDSSSFKIE